MIGGFSKEPWTRSPSWQS